MKPNYSEEFADQNDQMHHDPDSQVAAENNADNKEKAIHKEPLEPVKSPGAHRSWLETQNPYAIVPVRPQHEKSEDFYPEESYQTNQLPGKRPPVERQQPPEREPVRIEKQKQLLDLEELEERLRGPWQEKFREWGYSQVVSIPSPVKDYRGEVFALPARCTKDTGEESIEYIKVEMSSEGITYRFTDNNEVLETQEYRSAFPQEWLLEASRARKIVKSRPAFLYPELFDLPDKEVWPKNADIAVIGDPYQACDKEGVTIIEYEYADELFPPVIADGLEDKTENERWHATRSWYESLHDEDLRALGTMYGIFSPNWGNPYRHTVDEAIEACANLTSSLSFETDPNDVWNWEDWDQYVVGLRQRVQSLVTGSWSLKDYLDVFKDSPECIEGLHEFFNYKQMTVELIGKPEAWIDFTERWERYLEQLPQERLRQVVPGYEKKLSQVHHWLRELPTAASPDRVNNGMNYLDQFYTEMFQYDETPPEDWHKSPFYSDEVASARSHGMMADGAFGFFVPGHPVSLRTRKFLETMVRRVENTVTYAKTIWPELIRQRQSLLDDEISFDSNTMHSYLKSFETPFLKSLFFHQMTQRAVPIHGFFPDQVDALPPQDRILALTSVTMHGWNHLNEEGFYQNLEASLPFVKPGGKYILGPVNQSIYFSGIEGGFDTQGLTKALERLRDEGKIDYVFMKGKREYVNEYGPEDIPAEVEYGPKNVLLPGESAHSLTITRKS